MIDYAERPNMVPWPPLIYGAALVLGGGLGRLAPTVPLDRSLAALPVWGGLALVIVGGLVDGAGLIALRRHGTTIMPNLPTRVLATHGIYGLTRNPIYLGNAISLFGVAMALRWGWLLLLVPVTMVAITVLAIGREERHLELRFGDAYRAYKARVRRWI